VCPVLDCSGLAVGQVDIQGCELFQYLCNTQAGGQGDSLPQSYGKKPVQLKAEPTCACSSALASAGVLLGRRLCNCMFPPEATAASSALSCSKVARLLTGPAVDGLLGGAGFLLMLLWPAGSHVRLLSLPAADWGRAAALLGAWAVLGLRCCWCCCAETSSVSFLRGSRNCMSVSGTALGQGWSAVAADDGEW
jgi:hypothetical protein